MKLGILELQCNTPLVYTVSKVCPAEETIIFTTQQLWPRVRDMYQNGCPCKKYLKQEYESTREYLRKVEHICTNLDLLIVITISKNIVPFINFNPNCKKLVVVHNILRWFNPEQYLKFKISNLFWFFTGHLRKHILSRFDGVIVIYPALKQYIRTHTKYSKTIIEIPWTLYEEIGVASQNNSNIIRFVVPGGVNSARRDYNLVYEVFEELFLKYRDTISLEILGEPTGNGTSVLQQFKKLKAKGYNIRLYQKWVSRKPYQQGFNNNDIAILPMQEFCGPEIYGITKGTATLYDCISYTTPFILPHTHPQTKQIRTKLVYHNKQELLELLEKIIIDRGFLDQLKEEIFEISQHFTLEKQQHAFTQQLRGVFN